MNFHASVLLKPIDQSKAWSNYVENKDIEENKLLLSEKIFFELNFSKTRKPKRGLQGTLSASHKHETNFFKNFENCCLFIFFTKYTRKR